MQSNGEQMRKTMMGDSKEERDVNGSNPKMCRNISRDGQCRKKGKQHKAKAGKERERHRGSTLGTLRATRISVSTPYLYQVHTRGARVHGICCEMHIMG